MAMDTVMAIHITVMDITTITTIHTTTAYPTIEVDEIQITIEHNLVEDQMLQHEILPIAVPKQHVA